MTSSRILTPFLVPAMALWGAICAPWTLGPLAVARAAPLDEDACAKIRSEHQQLKAAGVEKDMARGPAWALVNLATERLDKVQRFIELEELLVFRCREKTLVTLPTEQELSARKKAARDRKANGTAATEAEAPSQWGATVTRSRRTRGAGDTQSPPADSGADPLAR